MCRVHSFYDDFPKHFRRYYVADENQNGASSDDVPMRPILWKYVGDEILFCAPLLNAKHVLAHVSYFGQAISKYNNEELCEKNVKCKGTVWLAGFPVNNRIVQVPSSMEDGTHSRFDFIGSSIDCGFRIAKFSSPRHLVLSLDLVWMIAEVREKGNSDKAYSWIEPRYHGTHELKGVFSGKQYPVFWVDLHEKDEHEEDKWTQFPPICASKDIIQFCGKIAGRVKKSDFVRPFIVGDPSALFRKVPEGFDEQRNTLLDYQRSMQKSVSGVSEPQNVEDVPELTDWPQINPSPTKSADEDHAPVA